MSSTEDETFEEVLRLVAKTPELPRNRSRIGVGSKLAGRFEVQAKLGEGGMGQVFAAFDQERQTRVALKLLGQLKPQLIAQMKREFRAAAGLLHPNLVRLHELFSDGTEWFFTMELVEGATLPARLEQARSDVSELLRSVLGQLALGLSALHEAGTLHGDLKPSNFLITHAEERVVLLDFGLARPSGPSQKADPSGTPQYMAPEQARGLTLTEAADWYAFGVVLYEALTGQLPYRRPSAERLAGAPGDLVELCLALLLPDPADRPSGAEILQRLGVRPAAPLSVEPPNPPPLLIGRDHELAALQGAFRETLAGRPAVVLVHGPSGIGKTTLVESFVHALREQGALVLAGRCRERESIGYKAADGLIDGIVGLLDELSPLEAASLVPSAVADLAVLFPALRAASAVAQAPQRDFESSDQSLVRLRAIQAFGEIIVRLRERGPTVIWLDDLQWSDTDSALLIGPLLGGPEPVPVLFIGSYRRAAHEHGPLLDTLLADRTLQLPSPVEIGVGALRQDDAERMALSLLPAGDPKAVRAATDIGREAGGHPLFIAELAHVSLDRPAALGVTLVDLVSDRLKALPPRARQLLELVAIAGEPLPRLVLRRVQAFSPAAIEEAVDVLRAHRLVRSQGLKEHDLVDTHHDRIREIVVQTMPDVRRRQHHLGLAQTLEAWPESRPARQAAHYEAAGNRARAGHYWIAAADQAFRALAFAHAAGLYERGADLATLDRAELRAVQIRRAEALALAGKGPAAADVYLAQAETGARDEALELRRRAAEQLLLAGHLDRGLAVIEQVLGALGMRKTRGGRGALLPLLAGRALVRWSGLKHVPRTESQLSREELAQLDAAWTIAWSLGLVDPIRGAEFQARYLRLALHAGEPRRLMRALMLEASYAATSGNSATRRTAHLLQVASEIAAGSDDHDAGSLLCVSRGVVAYLQGEIEPALRHSHEALERLAERGTGAVWERMSAQRFTIASLFMLGRFQELSEFVPPLLAETEGSGNLYATAAFRTAYSTVAWLANDQVHEADRQLDLAREESQSLGFQLVHSNLLFGDTFRDLYTDDGRRAYIRIQTQWPLLKRSLIIHIGVVAAQSWQMRGASALLAADALAAEGQPAAARELRREARHAVRVLRRVRLPRARPMAELLSSAIDFAEGKDESAMRQLGSCIAAFDAQQMQMFAAAARVRLGEISGGDAGRELVQCGRAEMERQRVKRAERIVAMLAPGFRERSAGR